MKGRVTSDRIGKVAKNEVFVFGSNNKGLHAGGAARLAYDKFFAEWGNPQGRQGRSYAIPTLVFMGKKDKSLVTDKFELVAIQQFVNEFLKYAETCPTDTFFVTEIGCGIAGYTPEQIAPLFVHATKEEYNNVHLPQRFWDIILKK